MAADTSEDEAWTRQALEHPELGDDRQIDWDLLWLYRRKQGVQQPRPTFTGDIFENVIPTGEDGPSTVAILQHPCALMDKNNALKNMLLVAKVVDYQEVSPKGWQGNYEVMPLVIDEGATPKHQAVAFDQLGLVRSAELDPKNRIACMEIEGVTRLLQRWMNVNARVIVPCWRFRQVIDAQFAEAEGMESWCIQRQQARVKPEDAMKEATSWLDEKSEDTGKPRRDLLKNPQYRKHVVRQMDLLSKKMSQREIAERNRVREELKAEREAKAAASAPDSAI